MSSYISDIGNYLQAPLKAYHAEVEGLFFRLPTNGKIVEVVKRIFIALIIPLAYITLSLLYLMGLLFTLDKKSFTNEFSEWTGSGESPFEVGQNLSDEICQIAAESEWDRQEVAVDLIRASKFDSPSLELQRLSGAGILTHEIGLKLDTALSSVAIAVGSSISYDRFIKLKALLGQALEIKEVYKDSHHVFIHAQASPMMVFSYLIKEMAKKALPHLDLHHFKYLRAPCSTAEKGTAERIMNIASSIFWGAPKADDARKYSNRWVVSDNDMKVREELISADAYFFSTSQYESSIHFLANNFNILPPHAVMQKLANVAIKHFFPSLPRGYLDYFVNEVINTPVTDVGVGNLFVVCVPKDDTDRFQYRSHPFALPCNCHPESSLDTILDALQSDTLPASAKCLPGNLAVPQYRLYAPLLNPELGARKYRSYLLTPFAKAYRKSIKLRIQEIVAAIHQSSNQAVA